MWSDGVEPGSGTVVSPPFTVTRDPSTAPPDVTLPGGTDGSNVTPGQSLPVTGGGFTPGATIPITVVDEDGNVVAVGEVVADENGTINGSVTIPPGTPPGDYTVIVGPDPGSGLSGSQPITVVDPADTTTPSVTSPGLPGTGGVNDVTPGSTIPVVGDGFTPDATIPGVIYDAAGNPVGTASVHTDANGRIVDAFQVPPGLPPGDYTVVFTDPGTGKEVTLNFTVNDNTLPIPNTPPRVTTPGSTTDVRAPSEIPITGGGFTPGATVPGHLVDTGGNPVLGPDGQPIPPLQIEVDANGNFTGKIVIPPNLPPGDYYIVIRDPSGVEVWFPIHVTGPRVLYSTVNEAPAGTVVAQGTTVTYCAYGFMPGELVTAVIYSDPIRLPPVAADEDGCGCWDVTLPADFALGAHRAVATSVLYGDSTEATFTVVAPLPAPDPTEPPPGTGDGPDGPGPDSGAGPGSSGDLGASADRSADRRRLAQTGSWAMALLPLAGALAVGGLVILGVRPKRSRSRG